MVTSILKNILSSATEAELEGLFINAKEGVVIRNTLEDIGHTQHPTTMQTDNSTVPGIINETVKQHISKAINMRFYWVRDRCKHNNFLAYWAPGKYNMSDYHTKFHSPSHHKKKKPLHVHTEASPEYVPCDMITPQKECVK